MGVEETGGTAYLALYPAQLFLAVEHAVEFTHASRTRPRHRQRPINILLPRAGRRASSLREVLCVLTLILRYTFLPLRTSLLRQIIIRVCEVLACS